MSFVLFVVKMIQYLWLLPLGFAVGAYGTFIGAGGGFVLMPILLILYPSEAPVFLAAISLAVVFANAGSGSVAYARLKRIDYRSGLVLAAATIPGAILGAMTTPLIPHRLFQALLGTVMILAAAFIICRPTPAQAPVPPDGRAETHRLGTWNLPLGLVLSFFVGYASSLLGIGGGIIHVPVLVGLLGFPVHVATATSHFILSFMALAGTGAHIAGGFLADWHGIRRTIMLAIGVVAGAQLGAWLSVRIHGRWVLRALAIALAVAGARVLLLALQQAS